MEDAERAWRKKELEAAQGQAEMERQLVAAREAQRLEKERRLVEQAKQEKEEFARILSVQMEVRVLGPL